MALPNQEQQRQPRNFKELQRAGIARPKPQRPRPPDNPDVQRIAPGSGMLPRQAPPPTPFGGEGGDVLNIPLGGVGPNGQPGLPPGVAAVNPAQQFAPPIAPVPQQTGGPTPGVSPAFAPGGTPFNTGGSQAQPQAQPAFAPAGNPFNTGGSQTGLPPGIQQITPQFMNTSMMPPPQSNPAFAPVGNPLNTGGSQTGGPPGIQRFDGKPVNTTLAPPDPSQPQGIPPGLPTPQPIGPQGQPAGPQQLGGASPIEQTLNDQFFGSVPNGPFGGQSTPVGAPEQQRTGQFNPNQSPVQDPQQQLILDRLQNPGRFDTGLAQDIFNQSKGNLDQAFNQQRQLINEDSASRGLNFSSQPVGRLGDLASNQARALSGFETNINVAAANANAADTNSALGNALGFTNQQFGQQIGTAGFNQGANQQNFGQDLASRGFQAGENQRGFANDFNSFGLNAGFNNQNLQNLLGFGQQSFDNQMQTAGFNRDSDFMNQQLLMQLLGQS